MATGIAFGGPKDGERLELPDSINETVEVWGEWATTKDAPVRRCRKVYLYKQNEQYRARLTYVGEDLIWDDEEVTTDGHP